MGRDVVSFWNSHDKAEQRYFKPFVVCLRDAEDSQTGDSCRS